LYMDQPNPQNVNSTRIAQPPPAKPDDKTIPFDSVQPRPAVVSRQPINVGGQVGGAVPAPKVEPPRPAPVRPAQPPTPVSRSGERISGMKTFFAKLHVGSLTFLEEQIQGWLKENPGITIKATNVTTGEVQAKATEPNLIIVVWY